MRNAGKPAFSALVPGMFWTPPTVALRGARAGTLGADRFGPGAAGPPDHHQSRAGRSAQGRQPLRPADRARPDGRDRRHSARASSGFTVLGELGLDGSIAPVAGVLPAAIGANARGEGLMCPAACGPEAAWASPDIEIVTAASLIQLANLFKGTQVLSRPHPKILETAGPGSTSPTSRGRKAPNARSKSRQPVDITCPWSGRPAPASPCWRRGCLPFCRRLRRRSCSKCQWSLPSPLRSKAARSPIGVRFARRITPPACRLWSAAACMRGRAKCRSRTTAFCFSTSCRNSSRKRSTRAPTARNRRGLDRAR